MAFIPTQQQDTGDFTQTTQEWELALLQDVKPDSPEFKELLIRLYRYIGEHAQKINRRTAGQYFLQEFVNGNQWFNRTSTSPLDNRQEYQIVIDFGALPNAGTKSVPHNLAVTGTWNWTSVTATATDPVGLFGITLPYASPILVNNIELYVDGTNVNVITGSNRSNFTICEVVLRYLKI